MLSNSAVPPRAFEGIVSQIRELIAQGELSPGQKLPNERALSQELKVSRAALREALRTLEHAGLLELRTGRSGGAFIASGEASKMPNPVANMFSLGSISLDELTEVRMWITSVVARVATERATARDLDALEAHVEESKRLFQEGDLEAKTVHNIAFHEALAQTTGNQPLVAIIRMINEAVLGFAQRMGPERTRSTFLSRARLLKAMRAGDSDAAVAEMTAQLRRTHRLYARAAREQKAAKAQRQAASSARADQVRLKRSAPRQFR